MKITGQKGHSDHIDRLTSPKLVRNVTAALYAAGQIIEIEAETSITSGSVSGKGHVPSAPGEPPNANTRLLDTSIETVVVGDLHVQVRSEAPYAVPLEVGTSKMAARPYMGPASRKKRSAAAELVGKAVSQTASTGG